MDITSLGLNRPKPNNDKNTSKNGNSALTIDQIDFEGYWIASYGSHGLEIVEIEVRDGYLVAKKVTGDPHVPGGEISFEVDLNQGGKGRIQIAEKGFKNPEWAPGRLTTPCDYSSFIFEWSDVRRKFTRINVTAPSESLADSTPSGYQFKSDPVPVVASHTKKSD